MTIFNVSPIAIGLSDLTDGKFLDVNEAFPCTLRIYQGRSDRSYRA